jgi:hypothetical protein
MAEASNFDVQFLSYTNCEPFNLGFDMFNEVYFNSEMNALKYIGAIKSNWRCIN